MVEVAKKVADAIGAERVGIRLSPHSTFNDLPAHDEVLALYADLARALSGLLYLHVVGNAHPSFPETAVAIRSSFGGPIILNGNFEPASAESKLGRGEGELVAFGRPFIANPDLVHHFKAGAPLAAPDPQTFYTATAEGYTDYRELT